MASIRFRESERSFCSGLSFLSSTPARSASICRAPRLSVFSMSSTNVNTSPERSQPKQYQDCICGLTLKLGLSSWWKGQSPHKSRLRLVRRTCSCTILTRSTLALTSAKASSDVAVGKMTIVIGHGGSSHRLDQGGLPRGRVRRRHDRTSAIDGYRNGDRLRPGRVPARLQARDTVGFRHLRSPGENAGRRLEPPARPAPDQGRQVERQGGGERVPRLARAGR